MMKYHFKIRSFKNSNSPPAPLGIFETENQTFLKNDNKRKSLLRNKNKEKIDLLLTVAPRCTLLPLVARSYNTVYAVHSLHFALPYFAPLCSGKHRIYRNVIRNSKNIFLRLILKIGFLKRGINLIFSKIKEGVNWCFLHSVTKTINL